MLHTNAISFTNKFSKIRKNIRLCKFKNKDTRILLDKIVLSLPAISLQDLFQFLLYFPFFIWSNLDFLITGWPLTYSEILKMKKKKILDFSNYTSKRYENYTSAIFFPDDQTLQVRAQANPEID